MGHPRHGVKSYHISTKLLVVQDYFTISHFIIDKYNSSCFMHGNRMEQRPGKVGELCCRPDSTVDGTTAVLFSRWQDDHNLLLE
jgi:hypothetical protein